MRMTTKLRHLMARQKMSYAAAGYDGLTAKLICEAGFDVVNAAGFQIAASLGMPDAELYSMTENLNATRTMVNASTVPVIADCDTGFGNAVNVMRTVREFERIGVAGLLLEDQVSPKRCPAMMDPEIVSLEEGVGKIRAAVSARTDPDLVIIGRTDAVSVDEACRRVKAYATAGADMVFVINRCPQNYDDLLRVREAAGVPVKIHLMGWLEELSEAQLIKIGPIASWAFPTLLTVTQSLRTNLSALLKTKSPANLPVAMDTLANFKTFIGFPQVESLQRKYIPAQS